MALIEWPCPYCGYENEDIYELTVMPICGGCDLGVEWPDAIKSAIKQQQINLEVCGGEAVLYGLAGEPGHATGFQEWAEEARQEIIRLQTLLSTNN